MNFSKPSAVALALGMALSLLAVPSAGLAGPLDCLFGPSIVSQPPAPATVHHTSFMPTADNPAVCNPCGQQVTMVPEKKYRWTYSRIPKATTYKPVTTCDPCTGCPVTTYRPNTSYSLLPWLHREAYTVYKPAPTSLFGYNSSAAAACNPCGVGSNFALGASGCSTCSPGATVSGGISSSDGSLRPKPDRGYPERTTFGDEAESRQRSGYPDTEGQEVEGDIKPKPDDSVGDGVSTELPELSGPRLHTAVRPILPPTGVRTVSWELGAYPASPSRPASPARPAARPKLDVGGWHAVTK